MLTKIIFPILLFVLSTSLITAQSPVSGFMQGKGKGSVVVSYNTEKYDEVFLVPSEIKGVPVFNDVKINSVSLYASYGISNKLDVVLNAPYISAKGNASEQVLKNLGFQNERKGLQDLSLTLKYNPLNFACGTTGNISLMGALGIQTPLSDYRADEGLQSIIAIGNRSTRVNGLAIAHYKHNSGFFATAQGGYSFRSDVVPNAVLSELKVGLAMSKFYFDIYSAGQFSTSGTDILQNGFDGVFPKTRVSYSRVGINAYIPVAGGFGIAAGANTYISGRNVGKATGFYGALVASF